jgi:uncharacterized protein (TIGR03086 family)
VDPVTLDSLAIASTRARVAGLRAGDLNRSTTNAGWDVRAVIAHLVGGCLLYASVLRGETVDWATRNRQPIVDPLGQFDAAAAGLKQAIGELDDRGHLVTIPAGDVPATVAIAVHATDMLVHGWDLAVATGQDRGLDRGLCEAATAIISRFPASVWGNPAFYAERVATDSAEPADRLVALTGRDPDAARPEWL